MTSTAEPTLAPGSRLAHYEIRGVLGSGAMGTVYRAHDTSLDRDVAVKVLRARLAEDPAVVERFVREARAAARVNHPNLTHIYFVGTDMGCRFFAMEHVPGNTFEQEIAAHGPMAIAQFVDVMVQSARGLAAAHGAGVVHRDVKPSNLMLLPDGTVKVTDFGLAKSLEGDVGASGGGSLMGTPTFMSPEQCRGRDVDARTDIYALGLTAWFLLGGKAPYASESLGQMIQDQMNTPLPPIRDVRPELPLGVEKALAAMCAKDPAKRPASMDEIEALFEPFRPRPLTTAAFMSRAAATLIDATLIGVAAGLLAGLSLGLDRLVGFPIVPEYVFQLFFLGAILVLQFGSEIWSSTTIGKWLFHLVVVRDDGAVPSRWMLFFRFLCRYPLAVRLAMPDAPLWADIGLLLTQILAFVLAIAAFLAYRGRTVSDIATKTRVVYRHREA